MKQKIIAKLHEFDANGHPRYQVFRDWVEMSAIAIANAVTLPTKLREDREKQYLAIAGRYTKKEMYRFSDLLKMLGDALEEKMEDVLGDVYMKAGISSDRHGQFFTPYHLSQLMARMNPNFLASMQPCVELVEPSCGAGGSIIAAGEYLAENGIDYQRRINVTCQDLDWTCVYMCYTQLALLGFQGCVVQGDTLSEPYRPGVTKANYVFWLPKTFLP